MDEPIQSKPDSRPGAIRPAPVASFDTVARAYLKPLRDRLERIETWLKASEPTTPLATAPPAVPTEAQAASAPAGDINDELGNSFHDLAVELSQATLHIRQQLDEIRGELRSLREQTGNPSARSLSGESAAVEPPAVAVVVPERPVPPAADPLRRALSVDPLEGDWDEVILGPELCGRTDLTAHRQTLLRDVAAGAAAAQTLAGQLLLLHAANAEELPERLRHVGEAFYRWRPRSTTADDPMETALAEVVTARAEAAGLRNSIQLVRPGDRFDSTRHVTSGRGLEIVAVHGWVVLRDNQKVYTKATVTVK